MRIVLASIMMLLATSIYAQDTRSPAPPARTRVQTSVTKPKPSMSDQEAAKTRAAAEAREKARDARMKRDMGSICRGC